MFVIIINVGVLIYMSVVVCDVFVVVVIFFVEFYVFNVYVREIFWVYSYLSDKVVVVICGMGVYGYSVVIEFVVKYLKIEGE